MTVNSLLKEFDEFMAFQNLAAGTRGCYCGHVRKFLRTFRRDPKNISFEEIRDYLLKLKGSKLRDQAKFAIAKFYNEVVKELRPLTSIPNGKRPKYLPKSISPHECYRIFNAIDNVKHRLLIQLIYAGALRVSEPPRIRIRHLNADDKMFSNMMITCVDNVKTRELVESVKDRRLGYLEPFNIPMYWLDLGNTQKTGQVVLGTFKKIKQPKGSRSTSSELPSILDLFPNLKKFDLPDVPSCSLAEALGKQDLFINSILAQFAAQLIWSLFKKIKLEYHGLFVNLETLTTNPILIK